MRIIVLNLALGLALLAVCAVALLVGESGLTGDQLAQAFTPGSPPAEIIWGIRAPRAVAAAVVGGALGLAILFMRTSKSRMLRVFTKGYIEVFQGTPLLMQLFLLFFGVSLGGVEVPPWLAAGIALSLFTSAYLAEIWRGCVEAIPRGQWEASSSLAMTYVEQMRHVILPQALMTALDRDYIFKKAGIPKDIFRNN